MCVQRLNNAKLEYYSIGHKFLQVPLLVHICIKWEIDFIDWKYCLVYIILLHDYYISIYNSGPNLHFGERIQESVLRIQTHPRYAH